MNVNCSRKEEGIIPSHIYAFYGEKNFRFIKLDVFSYKIYMLIIFIFLILCAFE